MSECRGLLGIITPELGDIVQEEFNDQDDFLDKVLGRMGDENSQMHSFLIGYAEWRYEVLSAGTFVYRCIEVSDTVPIVTPETYHEIVEEVAKSNFSRYTNHLYKTLKENNPWIFDFVNHFSSQFPREKDDALNAGVTIYRFLEKQAVNNSLKFPSVPFDFQEYPLTSKLRKRLNIAIFTENYEIAYQLRDKINLTLEPL